MGTTFDTVASHSHHVAVIAYCLCRMEGLSEQIAQKAATMAIFHDLAQVWFDSDYKDRVTSLRTESAKKIAHAMKDTNPQQWWWSQFFIDNVAIDREKLVGKK